MTNTLLVWDTCPRCGGDGYEPHLVHEELCEDCLGDGAYVQERDAEPCATEPANHWCPIDQITEGNR